MQKISNVVSILIVPILLFLAWKAYSNIGINESIEQMDVYYAFVEGQRILHGENPYERVLTGDMRTNDKYATYFPMFYELSYVSQSLGLEQFADWLRFWRRIFIIFNFGIAVLLYYLFWRSNMIWLGFFAAAFWLFNRWTLTVMHTVNIDFLPIFFLVASLVVFPKNKNLGLFLYSLSLALKQIAIFILPLYLVWIWLSTEKDRVWELLKASLMIGSVPFLTSIPFLFWNMRGFLLSVLFSVTRFPDRHFAAYSLDDFLGWSGVIARAPMFALFVIVYWLCASRHIGRYTSAFMVMMTFISFNSVLFIQYIAWLIPLVPLIALDLKEQTIDTGV
jgi:hypothetical protein